MAEKPLLFAFFAFFCGHPHSPSAHLNHVHSSALTLTPLPEGEESQRHSGKLVTCPTGEFSTTLSSFPRPFAKRPRARENS